VDTEQLRQRALSPLVHKKTMSEEIAERIVLAIASGEQRPGDRLTENGIAEAMDISRVPAREALLYLQSIGVLTQSGRRGLKVEDFSDAQARDLREVRLSLETLAFRRAVVAVRADPSKLLVIDGVLDDLETLAGTDDAIHLAECDVRFHREVVRMANNVLLTRMWQGLEPHMMILMCRDWRFHRDRIGELKMHQELRDFLAAGSADGIETLLERHIPEVSGLSG
jgi:DNA-binding GntR family transcriptional regulator